MWETLNISTPPYMLNEEKYLSPEVKERLEGLPKRDSIYTNDLGYVLEKVMFWQVIDRIEIDMAEYIMESEDFCLEGLRSILQEQNLRPADGNSLMLL